MSSCDDTITTVESDTFKYFRTQFDSVSNNRISVEVRDIEGKQDVGSKLFGIATSLPISGEKLGRGSGQGEGEWKGGGGNSCSGHCEGRSRPGRVQLLDLNLFSSLIEVTT